MKSIKEKAEEVFQIEEYDSLETELQKRKMRLCYEHGANYVLEQIEDIIVNNEDNTLNMARCLVDCIKQLKK
jgi:hypothetical protein